MLLNDMEQAHLVRAEWAQNSDIQTCKRSLTGMTQAKLMVPHMSADGEQCARLQCLSVSVPPLYVTQTKQECRTSSRLRTDCYTYLKKTALASTNRIGLGKSSVIVNCAAFRLRLKQRG